MVFFEIYEYYQRYVFEFWVGKINHVDKFEKDKIFYSEKNNEIMSGNKFTIGEYVRIVLNDKKIPHRNLNGLFVILDIEEVCVILNENFCKNNCKNCEHLRTRLKINSENGEMWINSFYANSTTL